MTTLLEVNVLVALVWPTHEHHAAAHRWLTGRGRARWASCPLTQLALVRLLSNPSFSSDALTPREAVTLLARNTEHPLHEFWSDGLTVGHAVKKLHPHLTGHRQLTDAYLLALASRRRGTVATFDRGLVEMANASGFGSHAELVPVR